MCSDGHIGVYEHFRVRVGLGFLLAAVCLSALVRCDSPTPQSQFNSEIIPLLEANCLAASCHGVSPEAEASGDTIDWDFFFVRIEKDGLVSSPEDAYQTVLGRINTQERAEFSSLLQKPLDPALGGSHHLGGVQFSSAESKSYRQLRDWIDRESGGTEGGNFEELSSLQTQFAETVQPHLMRMQCMNQSCHGRYSPFSRFVQPLILDGKPVFSVAATKANYKSARKHLDFGADVDQSRLLRKILPLDQGGISHRGGNDIFFRSDQEAPAAIRAWAEAERKAQMGTDSSPEVTGIVFVRGAVAPSKTFSHERFVPGTDLYVLQPAQPGGQLRNLTGTSHGSAADIRDPAVNHDATRIAFSMRKTRNDANNIYEIGVDGTGLRQLTFDAESAPGGGHIANIQPTYGPDGRIYFASTRAGVLADSYDSLDTDIWSIDPGDPSNPEPQRFTYDPSPELRPNFIGTGKNYGSLAFTMRRTINGRYKAPIFRGVLDHNKAYHADPEIHIHHGITIAEDIVYGIRTMHDGRYASVLLNRDNQWQGGTLAIFDRQFGPEVPPGEERSAAVGGFRHAFTRIDPRAAAGGLSEGGLYRHPAPLPDGTLLVTHASGPIDLDSASSTPELGIYIAALHEDRGSHEPSLEALRLLIDQPGVSEYDAEPIVVRPLEDNPMHKNDWDATRESGLGVIAFRHVETLEAVFSNTEQRGPKPLRSDLVYARLLQALPVTPRENTQRPIGVTGSMRTQILGEVPLMGSSLYLRVPSDLPFRVQFLNADRMAVGAQQNRWNHVAPDEKFPGGVSPELFPRLCAGCHGSLSGDRGEIGGVIPDAISAASMTQATHQDKNPRRPLKPQILDAPITIDYRRDIAPLVKRSCAVASCHTGRSPAGHLRLDSTEEVFDAAYLALQPFVNGVEASAYTSELMERILGRELGAPRALGRTCPGQPALSKAEQLAFIRWIDMGAVFRGVAN